MAYRDDLAALLRPLDTVRHAEAIRRIGACRTLTDLEWLAKTDGGWIMPASEAKRLKLVRHGSGTFLVVEYDDGWTTRVSMQPMNP